MINVRRQKEVKMTEKTCLIGIGNGGCKILSNYKTNLPKIFLDTDIDVIEKYSGMRIGEKICGKFAAGGEVYLGELSVRECENEILKLLKDYENIIAIAPLGGGTSCGATKKLIELVLDNNKNSKLVTSIPFDFEGGLRLHKAVECISYIENLCEVIKVPKFNNCKKPISINKLFEEQDKLYNQTLDKICF